MVIGNGHYSPLLVTICKPSTEGCMSKNRIVITRPDGKEQVIDSGTVRKLDSSEREDLVKGVENDHAKLFGGLKVSKKKPRKLI